MIISTLRKFTVAMMMVMTSLSAFSQFVLDAEVRPRAEYKNGLKSLAPVPQNPGFAVTQRTRFNLSFNQDKMSLFVSLQDIRTWGDVSQLNSADANGLAIHQAWGQYQLSDRFAVKFGRQELKYDDQRFLGSVGWAQQARSHDLAMLKYKKGKLKVDLGIAYNQDNASGTSTVYTVNKNYKTMQYIWLHQDWDKLGMSVLVLNNGVQYIDNNPDSNETRFSQTIGTHLTKSIKSVKLSANLYYQMGNDVAAREISAYLIGVDAKWAPKTGKLFAGIGFEMQSGNDLDWKSDVDKKDNNKAFSPLYGTNHKFNGYMDYFYVGNHANSVGLTDLYLTLGTKINKSKLSLTAHSFMSSGAMIVAGETKSNQLGTELDLVYVLPMSKAANFKMGYSQMFATESMELIKLSGPSGNTNNWAWVMITLKPELFRHENKKPAPAK